MSAAPYRDNGGRYRPEMASELGKRCEPARRRLGYLVADGVRLSTGVGPDAAVIVKVAYGLTATTSQRDALGQMLDTC
jgi:hypothetical protein